MMDWVDIRLGDACIKIGSGATPRGGSSIYLDAGPISFIRSQNIYNEGFSKGGLVYLDEKLAQGLANVQVEDLDVLLNITGDSVARVCQVINEVLPARVNQHVAIIRTNQQTLWPTYLRYFLASPAMQAHMLGLAAVGATRNALTKGMIESFTIKCPRDVNDQKAIADVLSSLDKKIDANHRINQTLEAMAQAIFKSWFVDFDPVKAKIAAKAEGRDPLRAAMTAISGKPDAELDTLPPDQFASLAATAALFPDEMEGSELGEIPKGWVVCGVPDVIEVNPSRTLKKDVLAPYVDMANVPTHAARVGKVVPREFGSGSKFVNGDTLLARITPCLENGKTAYVDFLAEGEVGWGSTEFIVLRPKEGLPLPFAYFLCRHPEFRAFAISQMAGTSGRQRVPNDCFGAYRLVTPSVEVARVFGKKVNVYMKQIKAQDEASKTLAELRDALLPKLLSGELQVQDTEMEVEA